MIHYQININITNHHVEAYCREPYVARTGPASCEVLADFLDDIAQFIWEHARGKEGENNE